MIRDLLPLNSRLMRYARNNKLSFDRTQLDYLLSWLLSAISSDPILGKKLIFKGGTALKKCYFQNYRFSEDLDFTALDGTPSGKALDQLIFTIVQKAETSMNEYAPIKLICEPYKESEPHPDGQVAYKVRAQFPKQKEPLVSAMIEITFSEQVIYPIQKKTIFHEYGEHFDMKIQVYSLEEIILEKLRGILQHTKKLHEKGWTRSRTRDFYDLSRIYQFNKVLFNTPSLIVYLAIKCIAKNVSFKSPDDFFNPRYIEFVERDWNQHLIHLVPDLPPCIEVLKIVKAAIRELHKLQPTLGQLLGFIKYKSLLSHQDLIKYIKFRLANGADPDDLSNNGHHPLNISISNHQTHIAKLLINASSKLNLRDNSGLTPFENALIKEEYEIAFDIDQKLKLYAPRQPNQFLNKVPYQNQYNYEMRFY